MLFSEQINQRITTRFRRCLHSWIQEGVTLAQMAEWSDYKYHTIRREILENGGYSGYDWESAANRAEEMRKKKWNGKICGNRDLQGYIISKLKLGWSPAVIAGRAKKVGLVTSLCADTIYTWIYSDEGQALGLSQYLDSGKKKKTTRAKVLERMKTETEATPEFGEWQSDTIVFNGTSTRVGVFIGTYSRYVVLRRIEEDIATSMLDVWEGVSRGVAVCSSLTVDLGREFSYFSSLPYVRFAGMACEKGAVERVNRQLRRLGLDRNAHPTDELVEHVQNLLNSTPRASLDFATPEEVYISLTQGI